MSQGHRIRVTVSSAAAPYFNANPNTGVFEPDAPTPTEPVVARNTVLLGGDHASFVTLPVVKLADLKENGFLAAETARQEAFPPLV